MYFVVILRAILHKEVKEKNDRNLDRIGKISNLKPMTYKPSY